MRPLPSLRASGIASVLFAGLAWRAPIACASGASPYVPLNVSPVIERRIERVMILANQSVLTRPIPIERVLRALPRACHRDRLLCEQVRQYLDRFFASTGVTYASLDAGGGTRGTGVVIPNSRGESVATPVHGSGQVWYRPTSSVLLSLGANLSAGDDSRFVPEGTVLSVGDEYLQVDAGYRPHWFSPAFDNSAVLSTEAPTIPSLTLSNAEPLTRLGLEYQAFAGLLAHTRLIVPSSGVGLEGGTPRLAGLHLGLQPVDGWSIGGNAEWQFGGAGRPDSIGSFLGHLFTRTVVSNGVVNRFANRTLSLTSAYTTNWPQPITLYAEYANRDSSGTLFLKPHLSDLTLGVRLPMLAPGYDLAIEGSEWQNGWYTDYIWTEGLTEDGLVIGSWFGDWRRPGDAVGGRSASLRLVHELMRGDTATVTLRGIQNASYTGGDYRPGYWLSLEYSHPWRATQIGGGIDVGRDTLGASFVRLQASLRLDGAGVTAPADASDEDETAEDSPAERARYARYVEVGVTQGQRRLDYGGFTAAEEAAPKSTRSVSAPEFALGWRHRVSEHSDLGVRIDVGSLDGLLVGFSPLDWRYRFGRAWAAGLSAGAARFSGPTPAQGYYFTGMVQRRNVLPHWDLALEARYFYDLQRDKVLSSDPQNGYPIASYSALTLSVGLSRRF